MEITEDQVDMGSNRAQSSSGFIEFAKLRSMARFNLAASGVSDYPLRELPVRLEDLEINAPTLYGYAPLQERLARLTGADPDCIVHTTGTSMANHLAMAALLQPGDEVLVEEPAYEPILATARFLGARVTRFPRRAEDSYKIDCEQLARTATARTRLIVFTNLHNPTSALVDESTLQEVGNIARAHGARVLVDEVYLETLFRRRVRSGFHQGKEFVATGSLTKAYGLGGLRCGWILAEPDLSRRIWRLNDLFGAAPVHIAELLSVVALDQLEKIARRAGEIVETNRSMARKTLQGLEQIELTIPAWGTTLFPKLLRGSVEDLCGMLRSEYETSVVPGHFFERPDCFRIGLGGDTAMTGEGLIRLAAALKKLGN